MVIGHWSSVVFHLRKGVVASGFGLSSAPVNVQFANDSVTGGGISTLELHPWRLETLPDEAAVAVSFRDNRIALIPMGGVCAYRGGEHGEIQSSSVAVNGSSLEWTRQCAVRAGADVFISLRDTFTWTGPGVLDWRRAWWHERAEPISQLEFSAHVDVCGTLHSHLLPGILYDGNPGAVPSRLVPRLSADAENLFEEHKFPSPFVHVETEVNLELFGVTLHTTPMPVLHGHLPDQWWSLGIAVPKTGRARLLSVSGRLALNGENETIYDAQNHAADYLDAWTEARPGQIYDKHYRLQIAAATPWQSWRGPLTRCLSEQPALTPEELAWVEIPALEEAIGLKVSYALSRWFEDENACGMLWYPNRPEYAGVEQSVEYGWVGQNMRLGLSLWRWGKRTNNADLMGRGDRIAVRWLSAALLAVRRNAPAPTRYVIKQKRWGDVMGSSEGYARATWETLYELSLLLATQRRAGLANELREQSFFELLDWYLEPQRRRRDGLFPLAWSATGEVLPGAAVTAGALSVAALAEASALPGGERYIATAQELMRAYAAGFLDSGGTHPCGSALDSGCEDMESGLFLLIAARTLYRVQAARHADSNDLAQLLGWAGHAADWVLTWAYTWNVPLLPGTLLGDAGFRTNGLSDVSVQNRHLHVFSAAAEIAQYATLLESDPGAYAGLYREQARRMLVPIIETIARPGKLWGMDEPGEQTEQYNQTNYIQHPHDPVCKPRGGIARWFVPWMTVWVMSMAMDFAASREGSVVRGQGSE